MAVEGLERAEGLERVEVKGVGERVEVKGVGA